MKMDLKLSTVALALTLTACGGSDSEPDTEVGAEKDTEVTQEASEYVPAVTVSEDGTTVTIGEQDITVPVGTETISPDTDIVINLSSTSLSVANISEYAISQDVDINPGNSFLVGWAVSITEDNSSVKDETNNLYTAQIYLSDDELSDTSDLLIAEASCDAYGSANTCNQGGTLQCSYQTGGDNVITCDSTANITVNPVVDYVSTLDEYLDAVPKQTFVVLNVCLVNDSSNCNTISKAITLY